MSKFWKGLARALALSAMLAIAGHADGPDIHDLHQGAKTQHCCLCHTFVGGAATQTPDISPLKISIHENRETEQRAVRSLDFYLDFSRGPPRISV